MSKENSYANGRIWWLTRKAQILLLALAIALTGCESNKFIGAARKGKTATVKAMLDEGADVNQRGLGDRTALIAASSEGHVDTVQALLEKGAKVDAKSKGGWTALMAAARRNHCDAMRVLLDKGAAVDSQALSGETALMLAANLRRIDAVRLLLQERADVNATDKFGRTALLWAALERPDYAANFRNRQDYLIAAKWSGNRKVDVTRLDQSEAKVVEALLSHGANPNVREGSIVTGQDAAIGRTALHAAAWNGAESVVKLLLKHGADVNARDDRGRTALMNASLRGTEQHARVVKELLAHGADAQVRDNSGATALKLAQDQARYMGVDEIVRLLSEK